jgi:ACS family allantoate permease-like MFS transporter
MWPRWKTDEQPFRLGIFISGTAFGNLVGQGIDLGAIKLRGCFADSPWKWIYIILGPCTIFIGVLVCAILPSTPMKAWFLTPREREIAVRRLAANQTGIQTRKFKWAQAGEAFLDPQLYLLMVFSFTFAFSNNAVSR